MNANTLIAAITAAGTILVAITALLLNYRGFQAIDARFASLENSVNARFASVERRLELIETDLKEFFACSPITLPTSAGSRIRRV